MFNFTKREQIIIITALILVISLIGIIMINAQRTKTIGVQINQGNEAKAQLNDNKELGDQPEKDEVKMIAVHVKGQVNNPNVVFLEEGKRVNDAVQAAGGTLSTADLDAVNLAEYLQDGQEVYIPAKGEQVEEAISGTMKTVPHENVSKQTSTSQKSGTVSGKININNADVKALESLPGIGASIAQRIIDYRNQNGSFVKIEDIQNVSGIGTARYNQIKELIDVR